MHGQGFKVLERVSPRTERLDVQRKEREVGERRDGREVWDVVEAAQPQKQRPQLACPEVESTHCKARVSLEVERPQRRTQLEELARHRVERVLAEVQVRERRQLRQHRQRQASERVPPQAQRPELWEARTR